MPTEAPAPTGTTRLAAASALSPDASRPASAMSVHQVLARAFWNEGVRVVFGLMGDGNKLWLLDMAGLPGVRLVHARHEGAALAMADGYARAHPSHPGGVGVCAVTYGPGVTQLSTSLMVATKHRTALVVFAADVPVGMRDSGGHLDVDERAVLQAAGAKVREVRDPLQAAEVVRLAFHDARTEGRPVAVLVSVDLQDRLIAGHLATPAGPSSVARPISVPVAATRPDPIAVEAALDVLTSAHRPVVLVGRGAMAANARVEVEELVLRLNALVATSFLAKGWMDGHPRSVGIAGGFSLDTTRSLLQQADCVVAIGASLNDHTTDGGRLFPHARIVQIDLLPHALVGSSIAADVYLRADAVGALRCLSEGLASAGVSRNGWEGLRAAELAEDPRLAQIARHPVAVEPHRVDPRLLMLAFDRLLPEDALVVVGGGHFMAFAAQYLSNPGRRSFEMVFDFMTTGQAVPAAIGAAVARPDRLVVAVEGDASFLMHVQEIETAARSRIPLLVVVMNDGALGAEYHKLASSGHDPTEALAEPPDLAVLATALGGRGLRLDDVGHAEAVLPWFDPANGPHVVDCAVSRRVVGPL